MKLNDSVRSQLVEDVAEMLHCQVTVGTWPCQVFTGELATPCVALNWPLRRGPALCVEPCRLSYPVTRKDGLVLIGTNE